MHAHVRSKVNTHGGHYHGATCKVTEKTKCSSAFVHDVSLSSSGDFSGFVGQSGNRRRKLLVGQLEPYLETSTADERVDVVEMLLESVE